MKLVIQNILTMQLVHYNKITYLEFSAVDGNFHRGRRYILQKTN